MKTSRLLSIIAYVALSLAIESARAVHVEPGDVYRMDFDFTSDPANGPFNLFGISLEVGSDAIEFGSEIVVRVFNTTGALLGIFDSIFDVVVQNTVINGIGHLSPETTNKVGYVLLTSKNATFDLDSFEFLLSNGLVATEWAELSITDGGTEIAVPLEIRHKKSGSNNIDLKTDKHLKVVVLGDSTFDVLQVNPETVRFGSDGYEARPTHFNGRDFNHDGYSDMTFTFKIEETDIVCGVTSATLTGESYDAPPIRIRGSDTILVECL